MEISREYIKRLQKAGSTKISSGAGGNQSLDGYATELWVNENFLTKKFFDSIFQLYNDTTKIEPNGTLPTDTSKLNIKAMFGFWTDFYISALGNGGQASSAIYLSGLKDVQLSSPDDGQALIYNSTLGKWVNGPATSGTVTNIQTGTGLTGGPITSTGTISVSSDYQTKIANGQTAYGWGNHATQGYATQTWVGNKYLALAGGDMDTGARIGASGGALYLGNSNNASYVFMADMCSQSGSNYWKILASGDATFGNVLSNGYVTALSDYRKKTITEYFEMSVELIAEAPMIKYYWNDREDNDKKAGSIAQYWQKLVPELTPQTTDGMLSMDYGKLALLSAIAIARNVVNHEERIRKLEEMIKGF